MRLLFLSRLKDRDGASLLAEFSLFLRALRLFLIDSDRPFLFPF